MSEATQRAEQSVLGGLLIDNSARARLNGIAITDFEREENRLIFRAIIEEIDKARPADAVTVFEHLVRHGEAERAGGIAYLHQLAQNTPSAANIERYADIVHEAGQGRARMQLYKQLIAARNNNDSVCEAAIVRQLGDPTHWSKAGESSIGYTFAAAMSQQVSGDYFVKGVIGPGEVAVVFGDSGAMKSFLVTDIGLHVAGDMQWCGRRTKGAGVLFILGEGAAHYSKRLRAWALEHRIEASSVSAFVYPKAINLHADAHELQVAIATAERALSCCVRLIIVDTYSTNLGDGDEQSNSDAAIVLKHVRECIGPQRGVLFVHHVGHVDKARERGAYQLRANADIRFLVRRDDQNRGDIITLTNEKQKDAAELAPLRLEWKQYSLGTDDDGDPVSSIVLSPTEREPVETNRDGVHIGSKETGALNVLWKLSGPNGTHVRSEQWFDALRKAGTISTTGNDEAQHRSFNRIAKALKDGGLINRHGKGKSTVYSPRSTDVEPEGFAT